MSYDVVVVGGGIGGLTVAALLTARGMNTCLLERQPQVGGCVARVEISGLNFEPGMGLYPFWGPGDVHERVFSELPVDAPETRPSESSYLVRLPRQTDVELSREAAVFANEIRRVFPECASKAVAFYETAAKVAGALRRVVERVADLPAAGRARKAHAFLAEAASARELWRYRNKTALECLGETSNRFQRFIDAQLRAFVQTPIEECDYFAAANALTLPRQQLYSITGGPATLAERLADSILRSGGTVRLNSPVLRLAYDNTGRAIGVDLLSGETVLAKHAVISNMTAWDTYGKLIGLGRTPLEVKQKLAGLESAGAYLIYAAMEETAAARLAAEQLLIATEWEHPGNESELSEFTFAANQAADVTVPSSKRAVTIAARTDVSKWFTFHENEEEHESQDQEMLEALWKKLHASMPELGAGIEVLDTATPRTFYELTRRKLGMVGGTKQIPGSFGGSSMTHLTTVPNVFMVGDTIFPGAGIATVSHSALALANEIVKKTR